MTVKQHYPNVYLLKDSEPVAWVGMFIDVPTAEKWVANRPEKEYLIQDGFIGDLPTTHVYATQQREALRLAKRDKEKEKERKKQQ